VRSTQRLADAGAIASVGSTEDSNDNALAEAFTSLFKAELVRNEGPWKGIEDREIAVAEYVDWFDHRRLHGKIGLVSPAEQQDAFYRHNTATKPRAPRPSPTGDVAVGTAPTSRRSSPPSDTELNPHGLQAGGGSPISGLGPFARRHEAGLGRRCGHQVQPDRSLAGGVLRFPRRQSVAT
jgi:hypothetical protein